MRCAYPPYDSAQKAWQAIFILESSVGIESCEISIGCITYVGANLFARKQLIMRINSHLHFGQQRFLGLCIAVLLLRVRLQLVVLCGHFVSFVSPCAEVDQFAALTAKRTKCVFRAPLNLFATGGTGYFCDFLRHFATSSCSHKKRAACAALQGCSGVKPRTMNRNHRSRWRSGF